MPDPIFQFGGSGTAQDAEKLREAGRAIRRNTIGSLFPQTDRFIFGPGPIQRRFEAIDRNPIGEGSHIIGPKVLLSGRVKQTIAKYVSGIIEGVEAEEATTGETLLRVGEAIITPPDPQQFGVARNAYLPEGITDFVPLADRIRIIGFAEQRADDRRAALQRLQGAMEGRSTEQLVEIVTQSTALARSLRIDARISPRITQEEFLEAARVELARRAAVVPNPVGVGPVASTSVAGLAPPMPVAAALPVGGGAVPRLSPLDRFGRPVAMGSLLTHLVKPIRNVAIASGEAAEGVRRDLVSERADP